MILTNFFVHGFFITIIFIFYILIIYFNLNAFNVALENKIVNVYQKPGECTYNDISVVPDTNRCTKLNRYYVEINNLIYTLSTDDSNSSTVCKVLCNTYNENSTSPCQGNKIQLNQYNQCMDALKPAGGCRGLARPLGFRINKTSNQKVDFYAKAVLTDMDECKDN